MSSKLERMVKTAKIIADNSYPSIEFLCTVYEVSERTIYDDLRAIKEKLGLELIYDKDKKGYKFLSDAQKLPMFELTEGEFFDLAIGNLLATHYSGSLLENDLSSIFHKIKDRLPDKISLSVDELNKLLKVKPDPGVDFSDKTFKTIYNACKSNQAIELNYWSVSKNEISNRIIHPYCLQNHKNTWYLIAYCTLQKDYRTFALHRIKNIKTINEFFKSPNTDELNKWLNSSFQLEHSNNNYKFKIEFTDIAARHIKERTWHKSEKQTTVDENTVILEFEAQNLDEVKRWVLTWGENARVIEPKILIDKINTEIKNILTNYNSNGKG